MHPAIYRTLECGQIDYRNQAVPRQTTPYYPTFRPTLVPIDLYLSPLGDFESRVEATGEEHRQVIVSQCQHLIFSIVSVILKGLGICPRHSFPCNSQTTVIAMRNLTSTLAQSSLFRLRSEDLSWPDRIRLSYDRAKAIVQTYSLTREEILNHSPRYWELHMDPIMHMDGAAATLVTIHYNLCAGTIAMFDSGRLDLAQTLQDLLSYQLSGQFCLTELGHGLDVVNLETTASRLANGDFELNTPVERAAKYMPPTVPCGIPCVSVVFARLIVDGEDRGVKPFLVPMHDGKQMSSGIVSRALSHRGAANPVNHALTYFHHVHLPRSALLGDDAKPTNTRLAFTHNIARVISGTLSMGAGCLPAMRIGCYIAGRYSIRRKVIDSGTRTSRAIVSFSTQYIPILTSIVQTFVMQAFADVSCSLFSNPNTSLTMKHFVAAVYKATIIKHLHSMLLTLGDRCGAQGLFQVNQLSLMHATMRGAAIAEGDILGISIRFAVEVLLGRVVLPDSSNPDSLLAQHETSLIASLKERMAQASGHREMESLLLPQCQSLLEAIGHRLAYDAAVERGVDSAMIELYVASVISLDPGWYVQEKRLSCWSQKTLLLDAATALVPRLEELLNRLDVEHYVTAPIVSDEKWDAYEMSLETFGEPEACSPTRVGPLRVNAGVSGPMRQPDPLGNLSSRL